MANKNMKHKLNIPWSMVLHRSGWW